MVPFDLYLPLAMCSAWKAANECRQQQIDLSPPAPLGTISGSGRRTLPKPRRVAHLSGSQLYLQTAPEYRTKLRHVWLLRDVPAEVRKRLELPHPDEGIDLIARTRHGEYWAIQAKFRSQRDKPLTRRELGTFTAWRSIPAATSLWRSLRTPAPSRSASAT